jgi:hypothetical protein
LFDAAYADHARRLGYALGNVCDEEGNTAP